MKFNEKLVKLRKENLLSQEELAEKLGVTRQTISKWELEQTTPDMDKLSQIAKLFNVSVDELLNESDEPIKTKENIGEKKNVRPIIIISILVFLLLAIIAFLGFKGMSIIESIFGTAANGIEEGREIGKSIISQISNQIEEQKNEVNETKNNFKNIQNNISEQIEANNNLNNIDKNAINSKYESLYTGLKSKFFTESAIKYVIEDNIKNERKISVKYNDVIAKENDELVTLKSSLNKKEYLITYDYDNEGYICQMNIQDV